MQALAEAEAAKGSELSEAERWGAGVAAVAAAGDPEAAARCFSHSSNVDALHDTMEEHAHTFLCERALSPFLEFFWAQAGQRPCNALQDIPYRAPS